MLGLKRIAIPLEAEQVNEVTIKEFFMKCLNTFKENKIKMEALHEYYRGEQEILKKQRYNSETSSNEQIVENHALNIVNFKTSYNYGEPVQYSLASKDMSTDDISQLSKFMRENHKDSLDIENAEDLYCTGCTTRLIMPRKRKSHGISPFNIYNLDFDSGFVVYSSGYTKEKLFGVVISKMGDDESINKPTYEYTVYARDYIYTVTTSSTGGVNVVRGRKNPIGMVNMVECKTNKYYISPISVVKTMLDAINTVTSSGVDNVVDFINSILVIINNEFTKEQMDMVRENMALSLKSTPNSPADAKFLVNSLNHEDVNVIYENLIKTAYDIVGVPRSSTTVTSGGDTGEARLLGGGWTKAESVSKKEEKFLKFFEQETIDIVIEICKKDRKCNFTIDCSDVQIDFNRTCNDNVQSRCQALSTLIGIDMPKEIALNIVRLTPNVHEVAKKWEDYVQNKRKQELESKKVPIENKKETENVVQE